MSKQKIDVTVEGIDAAMRDLRESMRGIPIRWAGFRKEHDELARMVAVLTVTLVDAAPLLAGKGARTRRSRSRA